jgi:hypothetical protein
LMWNSISDCFASSHLAVWILSGYAWKNPVLSGIFEQSLKEVHDVLHDLF